MSKPTQDPPLRSPEVVVRSSTGEDAPLATSHAGTPNPISNEEPILTEELVSAVFSSVHREGPWDPADEIRVRAICGAVNLDFTRAELPASGVVEIDVRTIAGEIEITVPDGAEVELAVTPVLGSVEQKLRGVGVGERVRAAVTGANDKSSPPLLFRIYGAAIMGTVRVNGR